MADKIQYSEKVQDALKTIVSQFDREDQMVRERQVRQWRRYKYLWEGFTRIWFSEVAHDWRVWDEQAYADSNLDQQYYDKPVNVYRAYLESIIAALSINVPPIKCFPDDADNTLDCLTAKAGDQIAELIYKHNNAPLLWLHALFVYVTEGMTACYSYPKADEKFGTYKVDRYEDVKEGEAYICPSCGSQIPDETFTLQLDNQFQPDDNDVAVDALIKTDDQLICPQCAVALDPNLQKSPLIVNRIVGTDEYPKSRICLEIYGGLVVKVPNYARKQADCPYLIQSYETHYSNAIEWYPHLRDCGKIQPGAPTGPSQYEQWARLNPQYHGEYPIDTVTVRNCWLRPSSFNILSDEETVKELKKKFPDGAKVVLVNDQFADACNESLDDCWTLTYNPLSDYIHFDPDGSQLVSIQDITNDLISLTLQTVEHGIGQTFADPNVLNFKKYTETEVAPGSIYPAKPAPGKTLQDGFFELKTANLSPEVLPFFQKIQELGQLVSGALPSLFGGQLEGARTASEYSMSRAQALQRQQNKWKIFTAWWKEIFSKVIPMFIKEMQDDERDVQVSEVGEFFNVFIRKAETEGKLGKIELEANENLPLTWSQQKDVIMDLLQNSQNPRIINALTDPRNIKNLQKAIGIIDFDIPGEEDREKQLEEIQQLAIGAPSPSMNEMGMEDLVASVPIEPTVDDHEVHASTCRKFLVSEAGRQLKTTNPDGYQNILLHMQEHMQLIAPPISQEPQKGGNEAAPKGDATPLVEKENVSATS
jgi:hypothetical protein